jgi:hypothetical protein
VELRFESEEWKALKPAERARRCRLFAAQAHTIGASAEPSLAPIYEDLSRLWAMLAQELERPTGKIPWRL